MKLAVAVVVCLAGMAVANPVSIHPIRPGVSEFVIEAPKGGERAKKSTTFCVEIRDDKPTQVDCDELYNKPHHKPHHKPIYVAPKPVTTEAPPPPEPEPEPEVPVTPATPNPPQVIVLPPRPPQIIIPGGYQLPPQQQQPCEPEMGPIMVQPPPQLVMGPTGNCAGQSGSGYIPLPNFGAGLNPGSGIQIGNLPGINSGSLPAGIPFLNPGSLPSGIQIGNLPGYNAGGLPSATFSFTPNQPGLHHGLHPGLHHHPHAYVKPHPGLSANHPPHGIYPGGIHCTCKQVQPLLTVLGRDQSNAGLYNMIQNPFGAMMNPMMQAQMSAGNLADSFYQGAIRPGLRLGRDDEQTKAEQQAASKSQAEKSSSEDKSSPKEEKSSSSNDEEDKKSIEMPAAKDDKPRVARFLETDNEEASNNVDEDASM